jgi:mannan endo-1,4-beta-mannosidase
MIGQGEAYIQSHLNWQCDRAKTIKTTLGSDSGVRNCTPRFPLAAQSVFADFGCNRRRVLDGRVGSIVLAQLPVPRRHLDPRLWDRGLCDQRHPNLRKQGQDRRKETSVRGVVRLVYSPRRAYSLTFASRGACYYTTSNNDCPSGSVLSASQRNSNIKTWAAQITAAGVPWLYWQVLPNADPHVRPISSRLPARSDDRSRSVLL